MKLSQSVINDIIENVWLHNWSYQSVVNYLESLDLVFERGDCTQSILTKGERFRECQSICGSVHNVDKKKKK